jgi:hypothetical protein
MSSLAALQSRIAEDLWRGADETGLGEIASGPIAARAAWDVHRNTIISGLTNAMRLTYPTVDWLVGPEFFDQTALAYIRGHPPARAQLAAYGEAFPAFLEACAPGAGLPYLADVARFDLAVDQIAALSAGGSTISIALDAGVILLLDGSLRVLRLNYPADRLSDARADDGQSLEGLDMTPRAHAYALWRGAAGTLARVLPLGVAAFLDAVLAGAPAQEGLDVLLAASGEAGLAQLQSDLFFAPFARLQTTQSEDTAI